MYIISQFYTILQFQIWLTFFWLGQASSTLLINCCEDSKIKSPSLSDWVTWPLIGLSWKDKKTVCYATCVSFIGMRHKTTPMTNVYSKTKRSRYKPFILKYIVFLRLATLNTNSLWSVQVENSTLLCSKHSLFFFCKISRSLC